MSGVWWLSLIVSLALHGAAAALLVSMPRDAQRHRSTPVEVSFDVVVPAAAADPAPEVPEAPPLAPTPKVAAAKKAILPKVRPAVPSDPDPVPALAEAANVTAPAAVPSETGAGSPLALANTAGAGELGVPVAASPPAALAAGLVGTGGSLLSPRPSGNSGRDASLIQGYGRGVFAGVEQHKRYPRVARRLHLEGVVLIKLWVTREGALAKDPVVQRSSGHAMLDDEALRMVRTAAPFSPLPGEFSRDSAVIVIPVQFHLEG